MYKIKIIEHDTDKVINVLTASTEHKAEKIDRGININLNHERFYTLIEEIDSNV